MIAEMLILFVSALVSVYLYLTRNYDYWKKRGIHYIKPKLLFGNLYDAVTLKCSIGEHLENIYKQTPNEPYVGFFAFDKPALLLKDTEMIKNVLIKDFDHFEDRVFGPDDKNDALIARGLFAIPNPKWSHLRRKLNPSFTSMRIKNMAAYVNECCKMTIDHIKKKSVEGESVEMKNEMGKLVTNAISACAFGLDAKALTAESNMSEINSAAFELSTVIAIKKLLMFFAPSVVKRFSMSFASKESYDIMRNVIWQSVKMREETGINRHDFLDLAMEIRKKGGLDGDVGDKIDLEGDDFVAQCYIFLIAGYESSSTTLSLCIYELAKNIEIQNLLRKSVKESIDRHGGEISYDSINDMKYLQMVLNETMRKYPSLPFLDRICTKKYRIPGTDVTLDKGTLIYIPLMGLHNDPKYFENPHVFDPERFSPENVTKFPKMAYLPFGEGKRSCIGLRFGQLQTRMAIAHLINNFSFELAPDMCRNLKIDPRSFTISMTSGIHITLKPL